MADQRWYEIRSPGGDGFSGSPVIGRDSTVVGIRWGSDKSGLAMATPPTVIRGLFPAAWLFEAQQKPPPVVGAGVAAGAVVQGDPPPLPLPPIVPPESSPCAGLGELREEIAALKEAVNALALREPVPGPPGKDGAVGPQGPPGPVTPAVVAPWYLKGTDPETGKEIAIPIMPGDKVRLLEPLNLRQVTVEKARK